MKRTLMYCGNHGGVFKRPIRLRQSRQNPETAPWNDCDEQEWRAFWGARPESDLCLVNTKTGKHLKP